MKKLFMIIYCILLPILVSCEYLTWEEAAVDTHKVMDTIIPIESDEWVQSDAGIGKPGDIKLYFAHIKEKALDVELRHVDNISIKAALDALIAGPRDLDHVKVVPAEMKCLGIAIKGDVAYLNLNKALFDGIVKGTYNERLAVYALVNTVTHIPSINKVQILIDGKIIDSINGEVDISEPLAFNLAVVNMK